MKYFENFPIISYQGKRVRDITRRNTFIKQISTNPYLFLPYTIKEGQRAEDIALDYYGSVDYIWVIYLANNILDPYHEWPLDTEDFNKFLIDKYADVADATGYDIIAWLQDENIDENILYYYFTINQ